MIPLAEEIKQALLSGWGFETASLEALQLGFDAEARTYRAVSFAGDQLFVKYRKRLDPGIALSSALKTQGVSGVVAPLATLSGSLSVDAPGGVVLAYPYITSSDVPMSEAQWTQFGALVRQVHEASVEPGLLEIESFQLARHTLLPGIQAALPNTQLGDAWNARAEVIAMVESRFRQLGDLCRAQEWPLVPCHCDLHSGNLMVDDAGSIHLIDWDGPRVAPRERDLMFVLDGGIACEHGEKEEAWFLSGYGSYSPSLLALTYYRFSWAFDDILGFAAEALGLQGDDPHVRDRAVRYFCMLFGDGGIVESAFRSDARLTGG